MKYFKKGTDPLDYYNNVDLSKVLVILFTLISTIVKAHHGECGLNPQARALALLITEDVSQQREVISCDKNLTQAAFKKAQAMAEANIISHNISHMTPNEFIRKQGIELPLEYEILGNQVESVLGGKSTAQEAFDYFMTSPDHKAHLLGENDFFKQQHHIAVGYYYDESKTHEYYWVVYITAFRHDYPKIETHYKVKFVVAKSVKPKKKRFKKGDTLSKRKW